MLSRLDGRTRDVDALGQEGPASRIRLVERDERGFRRPGETDTMGGTKAGVAATVSPTLFVLKKFVLRRMTSQVGRFMGLRGSRSEGSR